MALYAHQIRVHRKILLNRKIVNLNDCHKLIYSLFDLTRNEDELKTSVHCGFNWGEIEDSPLAKVFMVISDREANSALIPDVDVQTKLVNEKFLEHDYYDFTVVVNPVHKQFIQNGRGKMIAAKTKEDVSKWFNERAEKWGFNPIQFDVLSLDCHKFKKWDSNQVVIVTSKIKGRLKVTDKEVFKQSFSQGIGRGRAYGCGMLLVIPIKA